MENPFEASIEKLLEQVLSLAEAELPIMSLVMITRRSAIKNYNSFLEKEGELKEEEPVDSDNKSYLLPQSKMIKADRLERKIKRVQLAETLIPRSLIISLVSYFDAFLGNLLQAVFNVKQELLNSSEKSLTFSQLLQLGDFEEAKRYIVEKEIESVLRKSHTHHFEYLENRLSVPLRKGLDSWTTFIELTERRNLFAHNDGIVSSQYLAVCNEHKVSESENIKLGSKLHVDGKYFEKAYECILEIGIKLNQVLWRKLQPPERESCDDHLIKITYDLLLEEEYNVVIKVLDFARNELMRHSNQDQRLIILVNLAQAHKWKGEEEITQKIVDSFDWSAVSDKFKLAYMVLKDKFDVAANLLEKEVKAESISKHEVDEWPLFKKFRDSEEFKSCYTRLYGESNEIIKSKPQTNQLPSDPELFDGGENNQKN